LKSAAAADAGQLYQTHGAAVVDPRSILGAVVQLVVAAVALDMSAFAMQVVNTEQPVNFFCHYCYDLGHQA
jgi:hypothetical protein